jgi:hypothetical protein
MDISTERPIIMLLSGCSIIAFASTSLPPDVEPRSEVMLDEADSEAVGLIKLT